MQEYETENPAEEVKEERKEEAADALEISPAEMLQRAKKEEARRYSRTIRDLPISERIQATKENRILNRWADMNRTWGKLRNMIL